MKASVEPLEGNKVKLSVEVDEQEFEKALDSAFRKIAQEVQSPGSGRARRPASCSRPASVPTPPARRRCVRRCPTTTSRRCARPTSTPSPRPRSTSPPARTKVRSPSTPSSRSAPRSPSPATTACRSPSRAPTSPTSEVDEQLDRLRRQFGELDRRSTAPRPHRRLTSRSTCTGGTDADADDDADDPEPVSTSTTTSTRSAAAPSCPSSTSELVRRQGRRHPRLRRRPSRADETDRPSRSS